MRAPRPVHDHPSQYAHGHSSMRGSRRSVLFAVLRRCGELVGIQPIGASWTTQNQSQDRRTGGDHYSVPFPVSRECPQRKHEEGSKIVLGCSGARSKGFIERSASSSEIWKRGRPTFVGTVYVVIRIDFGRNGEEQAGASEGDRHFGLQPMIPILSKRDPVHADRYQHMFATAGGQTPQRGGMFPRSLSLSAGCEFGAPGVLRRLRCARGSSGVYQDVYRLWLTALGRTQAISDRPVRCRSRVRFRARFRRSAARTRF
jgi:hypothetical protein